MDYEEVLRKKFSLKRDFVKSVRDGLKALYPKEDVCYITGETKDLEFHHYRTISLVIEEWLKEEGLEKPTTSGEAHYIRERFALENAYDVIANGVTLTSEWHKKLHSIYGVQPGLHTEEKQKRWVNIQKEKLQ